jgi:hypothetical protein
MILSSSSHPPHLLSSFHPPLMMLSQASHQPVGPSHPPLMFLSHVANYTLVSPPPSSSLSSCPPSMIPHSSNDPFVLLPLLRLPTLLIIFRPPLVVSPSRQSSTLSAVLSSLLLSILLISFSDARPRPKLRSDCLQCRVKIKHHVPWEYCSPK